MSEHMIIRSSEEADCIESNILNRVSWSMTKEKQEDIKQALSHYVSADMPREFIIRALSFAVKHFGYHAQSSVAKIVIDRVRMDHSLLSEQEVATFVTACLNRMVDHYGYLGYDVYGYYYMENDWYTAKYALLLILEARAVSYLPHVMCIHTSLRKTGINMYPVGSAESCMVDAEVRGVLEFVIEQLKRA